VALVRKRLFRAQDSVEEVLRKGFQPPSRGLNALLGVLAAAEVLPQSLIGTSVVVVFRRPVSFF
ncbi:MAG: hypothetical protein P8J30_03120, partial [Ilumatobacter sp.]|nr:hypothetical protein [Ilumatobacter sp.]